MQKSPVFFAVIAASATLAAPSWARAQAAAAKACTMGQLILGNPNYRESDKANPSGSDILSGPPIQFRSLVFEGSHVYTNDGQEIWLADLPSRKMKRVAGEMQKGLQQLKDGPCASARFINIHGMAELPDGSLAVADWGAHAVLKVTDPSGSACKVTYLAGTSTPSEREGKRGDADGPGAKALLGGPEWPGTDTDGNIYFVDSGSAKLKKVAADAENTVSTVAQLPDAKGYGYPGLTVMGDKVYVVSNTFTTAVILEITPETGAIRKVLNAESKMLPPLDSTTSPALSSITNDGKNLIVSGQGYIWRVTPQGKAAHIAGGGSPPGLPPKYDPAGSVSAKKALLFFRSGDASLMGTMSSLAYQNGVVFWRGRFNGAFVMSFACN